ncbi:MAG: GNAT family N-acetyltransferase [Sphingobacteriaceae bacterium]|jgi:GNAT superfamily N-acetyltransferase|nr:GNAT family N-acetyltransferase [Sphingobacteriaceae bacterium]
MILIRKAKEEDMPIISDLAELIWPQTYTEYINEEQLRYMLDLMYNKGELLSQLQQGYTFLIAEDGSKDVGFACSSLIDAETKTYKLHKLYVLPEMHGKGVGKILINEIKNLAERNGGKFLQLNVNRNNKAKDFYLKGGFKIKETVDVNIGNGFFMNDYVMELSIGS